MSNPVDDTSGISTAAIKYSTLARLGVRNLIRVAKYRLSARLGVLKARFPIGESYAGPFFTTAAQHTAPDDGEMVYFSRHQIAVHGLPDWFTNPFSDESCAASAAASWMTIPDFDPSLGDIKCVWEPSRFTWAVSLAREARRGKPGAAAVLNRWVEDWVQKNPKNAGPNWKCGQECAIRVLNLLMAAQILGEAASPSPALLRFVAEHCDRIARNIGYALAQDNNHGTCEAAGLFVGGSWLAAHGSAGTRSSGRRWAKRGAALLERLSRRLIERDGSFSQRSVNYHRLLLDTLSIVEFWRKRLALPAFSRVFYDRGRAAAHWLFEVTDPATGGAPNFGANDGALLLTLHDLGFRDFRPSVQTAYALFFRSPAYEDGPWDEPLAELGLELESKNAATQTSCEFREGGYVVLRKRHSWALVHCPRYRFRPSQADALHVDFWVHGENILRDGGSYSYHCREQDMAYFGGAAAHNTVEFDGRDQMPRLSRFLFGAWTKTFVQTALTHANGQVLWRGGYRDYRGATHTRTVSAREDAWDIRDEIDGYRTHAVLRWRLAPGPWGLLGTTLRGRGVHLDILANVPIEEIALRTGQESLYYMERREIPVLEVVLRQAPAVVTTTIRITGE